METADQTTTQELDLDRTLSSGEEITSEAILTPGSSDPAEVSNSIFYVRAVLVLFGLIGVLGNALVLFVIYRYTNLKKRWTSFFVIHQSWVDLTASLLLVATYVVQALSVYPRGTAGELLCLFLGTESVLWVALYASTFNLVVLAMERYVVVVHPIVHRNVISHKKMYMVTAIMWVFSAAFALGTIIPTSDLVGGVCLAMAFWPSSAHTLEFGIFHLVLIYVSPLLLMIVCYSLVLRALWKRRQVQASTGGHTKFSQCSRENEKTEEGTSRTAGVCQMAGSGREDQRIDKEGHFLTGGRPGPNKFVSGKQEGKTNPNSVRWEGGVEPIPLELAEGSAESARKEDTFSTTGGMVVGVSKLSKVELSVMKMLIVVTVAYAICWTPMHVFFFMYILGSPFSLVGASYYTVLLLCQCNCFVNPIIYTFKYDEFRMGLRKMFGSAPVRSSITDTGLSATSRTMK